MNKLTTIEEGMGVVEDIMMIGAMMLGHTQLIITSVGITPNMLHLQHIIHNITKHPNIHRHTFIRTINPRNPITIMQIKLTRTDLCWQCHLIAILYRIASAMSDQRWSRYSLRPTRTFLQDIPKVHKSSS
jgi:hypothetical protein